jgi:ParB family transcriptional regulator, chromosome partitioning protein
VAKLRGLPDDKQMRHDFHFVDRLTARPIPTVGSLIPISSITPNPQQPRQLFDGIDGLVASIKEKGVLEPLLVRQIEDDRYQIIAGERRFRAAQEAGLSQVPCIEIDVDDRGCLEISLVENLQRRDLTPFEEADAVAALREQFGFTHDEIGRKLGRSRTSVTEVLSLATVPSPIRDLCREAGITARSMLLQVARQADEAAMRRTIEAIRTSGLSREEVRDIGRGEAPRKDASPDSGRHPAGVASKSSGEGYVFRFRTADRPYAMTIRFADRESVPREELIGALEEILRELRQAREPR